MSQDLTDRATTVVRQQRRLLHVALTLALAMTLVVPLSAGSQAEATHFRSGHGSFTWESVGNRDIEFQIQSSFRRDGYATCYQTAPGTGITSTPCSGADGNPAPGDIILETIGDTYFSFGDGSSTPTLYYQVNSVDITRNWVFGYALDPAAFTAGEVSTRVRHTYAADGPIVAFMDTCCRLSGGPQGHVNNPDGFYRIEALINVGSSNRSPVSVMPPIIECEVGEVCQFPVLANDPDGDTLAWRLATSQEASGSGGFFQPGEGQTDVAVASVNESTGLYTWDTDGAQLSTGDNPTYYSTQVVIEDLDGNGEVKSKVAVDFFIQLREALSDPPEFDDEPTVPGQPVEKVVAPGEQISFVVRVCASDPDDEITLNVINLPSGATMTPPLPHTEVGCVTSTFTWTAPGGVGGATVGTAGLSTAGADESIHDVVFQATDQHGSSAVLNYRIRVTTAGGGEDEDEDEDEAVLDCGDVDGRVFPDVASGSVHSAAISCAGGLGLVQGQLDGTFGPASNLSRGQAASIVFRSLQLAGLDLDEQPDAAPSDAAGSTHRGAIGALIELDVIEGYADSTFRPRADVTRAQLASLIARATEATGVSASPTDPPFSDVSGGPHAGNIGWASSQGIIEGYGASTFGPNHSATRAQTASVIIRWLTALSGPVLIS